jgi:hypothetical protein
LTSVHYQALTLKSLQLMFQQIGTKLKLETINKYIILLKNYCSYKFLHIQPGQNNPVYVQETIEIVAVRR